MSRRVTFAVLVFCLPVFAWGADAPTQPAATAKAGGARKPALVFLDPEKAGVDYKIQGEYAQNPDGSGTGAQVIALRDKAGDTTFHAVVYPGGLPGAGWDGKAKTESDGKLENDKAVFAGGDLTAAADGGAFSGTLAGGAALALKKVERKSPTLGAPPPAGAAVLFDGKNTDAWASGKLDERGLLASLSAPRTKQTFTDFTLHVEFLLPFMPASTGQGRGNSGVYLQDRYEVQVLDSFGLKGADNECGGIYKNAAPKVNMCLPPLAWQTYDIDFTAARFEGGRKTANAKVTVRHNGVTIHENLEVKGPTGGGKLKEDGTPGPIFLQDHHDPVFYRNVWVVEKK